MNFAKTESELLQLAINGDIAAFQTLCEQNRERLWRVVCSISAPSDREDLAQEALIRAFRKLHTYRTEASFSAWLCRIAINAAHDYQRSAWRRRVIVVQEPLAANNAEGSCPADAYERREFQGRVRLAVAGLPEKFGVPIWLHYFEEFSFTEIANLEHTAESTVRSRIKTGIKRLGRELSDLLESHFESDINPMNPKGCGI